MAQWDNLSSRGHIDDRRGTRTVAAGISLTSIAVIALFSYLQTGTVDVGMIASEVINGALAPETRSVDTQAFEGADEYEVFAATVLGSTNDTWGALFKEAGAQYRAPHFVLFRGRTSSACGGAESAIGPHYCPTDETIYLDETFFEELYRRFGGSTGDVAQAYVIAHEVGHHVQALAGIEKDSVALELQADCFAGVWAHSIRDRNVFEPGEIQEALDAAAAVGDDNIQRNTMGTITPDTFTHGSSAQRVAAFERGFTEGTIAACSRY